MKLQISSGDRQFLLDAAAATPGQEVCGLILGQPGRVESLLPARNVARDPGRSFEIEPATLLAAHRTARGEGRQVIGHWHSHPNGRLEPSSRDAARATDNGQVWLIIAAGDISGWIADSSQGSGPVQFRPVTLEVA